VNARGVVTGASASLVQSMRVICTVLVAGVLYLFHWYSLAETTRSNTPVTTELVKVNTSAVKLAMSIQSGARPVETSKAANRSSLQ